MKFGGVWNGIANGSKARLDLRRLQRDSTPKCQVVVTHGYQSPGPFGHAARRPPLDDTERREAVGHMLGRRSESRCVLERDFEPPPRLLGTAFKAFQAFVKIEDDMVDGTSVRKTRIVIKFGGIFGSIRRLVLLMIGERATIAKDRQARELRFVQPKELPRSYPAEAHCLGFRIFSTHSAAADNPSRDEHPFVRSVSHDFMRIGVVPIGSTAFRIPISDEIVSRIDMIEAIGKYELHRVGLDSLRSSCIR